MSKKQDEGKMLSALSDIYFPSVSEAEIACEVFSHWIRTRNEPIYVRDFAALARMPWPIAFHNYAWPVENLLSELLNGRIRVVADQESTKYRIFVPDPILITEEKDKEENK